MRASRYEWEMLYVTPSEPGVIDDCRKKLGERKWDVVMVGSKCFFLSFFYPFTPNGGSRRIF